MESGDYIYPTIRSRIIILLWVAIFTLLYFLSSYFANDNFFQDESLELIKIYIYVSNIAMFLLFLAVSFWLFRLGRKIQVQDRFPPIGFPVLLKTKIRKGKMATAQAIASYISCIFTLLFSLFYLYGVWLGYDI